MPRYRDNLPQLSGQPFLTDGGLETYMIFHKGIELPHFASFVLHEDEAREKLLVEYFDQHTTIAEKHGVGLILEANTWRANPDWVERVTGNRNDTDAINRRAVDFLAAYRAAKGPGCDLPISGCVGPRGDGYIADNAMSTDEAADYHRTQIETHAASEADLVTAYTLNYVEEAIGIAHAAAGAGMPVALSFTVETDGRLPTGQPLGEAIQQVDEATAAVPAYYLVNCAHPTHFEHQLPAGASWLERLRGALVNASRMSHEELEASEELDDGDPIDLGERVRRLRDDNAGLNILGGCCGTDHRHIAAIAEACFADT